MRMWNTVAANASVVHHAQLGAAKAPTSATDRDRLPKPGAGDRDGSPVTSLPSPGPVMLADVAGPQSTP